MNSIDWNDLTYVPDSFTNNMMKAKGDGVWFDQASNTIRWYENDTFILRIKPTQAVTPCNQASNSIYDNPVTNTSDYLGDYYFTFSLFSLTGDRDLPVYEISELEMRQDGTIGVIINAEISKTIKAGIYTYSLVAYKVDNITIVDHKTLVGRDKGKIQVLSA